MAQSHSHVISTDNLLLSSHTDAPCTLQGLFDHSNVNPAMAILDVLLLAQKKRASESLKLDVKVVGHTQNKAQGSKRKSWFNGILVETLLHWSSIRIWENLRMEKLAPVLHRNLSLGSVLCTPVATNSHFRLSSKWQKALACLASVPSCLCCPSAPPLSLTRPHLSPFPAV